MRRQPRGTRRIGSGHPCVRVLFDGERRRPRVLHGVTQTMERPDARVAAPGEHQFRGTARADQLVVDHVGRQPDQRQIAATLPDDLVARGEGNEVSEPLERNDVAVPNEILNRFCE